MNNVIASRQFDDAIVVGRVPALAAKTVTDVFAALDPLAALRTLIGSTPVLDTGVRVASPSLHRDMHDWLADRPAKNKRVALSALAYSLRMASRCTPFGLFASVGCVELGRETSLSLGALAHRRLHIRPDVAWSAHIVGRLRDAEVFDDVHIFANDLIVDRGDGFHMYLSDHAKRVATGPVPVWRYDGVYLRANPTLRLIQELCAHGVSAGELIRTLELRLGGAPAALRGLVGKLLDVGLLVTQRPSLLADPFTASAGWLATHSDGPALNALAAQLSIAQAAGLAALTARDVTNLEARMVSLAPAVKANLQLNMTHRFDGSLDAAILDDVALLAKISLAHAPPTHMNAEIELFVERYESIDRLVPLLELVQNDFVGETQRAVPADQSWRDRLFVDLAAQAVRDGKFEVELTPGQLDRVYPGLRAGRLTQSCEIGFRVSARDVADIARGAYRIVPTKLASSNGIAKSARRFAHHLGQAFIDRVAAVERRAQSDGDDIVAELEYLPLDVHYAHLVARTTSHQYIIADAATPCPAHATRISPADILVGIENGRFVAYARSLGKRLCIEANFLLDADYFAPPHMRLLSQISCQDRATPGAWSWGSAAALMPFLPRLRAGRVVLAPATWSIPKDDLSGSIETLSATIRTWRLTWHLPRWVVLSERDMQLPLDLDAPVALELLHDQLRRYGPAIVIFEELLPAFDELWLHGDDGAYCHEFVASLIAPAPSPLPPARTIGRLDLDGLRAGTQGPWTSLKLYVAASEIDGLIVAELARLVGPIIASGAGDAWFFLRYRDPEPHLRIRIRSTSGRGWDLVDALVRALDPLVSAGVVRRFTFDTYLPEYERYGGADALDAVQRLFYADSEAVLRELAGATVDLPTRRIAALRSLAPILAQWFRVLDLDEWLHARAVSCRAIRDVDYALVRSLRSWLVSFERAASRQEIAAIARLAHLARTDVLSRPLHSIFESTLHMHFNRFGIAMDDEPFLIAHLWRALFRGRREEPFDADVPARRTLVASMSK